MAIEKVRIANLVVDDFERKIRQGELKKGDKLPNENELAKILNISRLSLREGLQLLKSMGAISQRPKVGTVVICDNPDLWIRIPSASDEMDEDMIRQLNETRVLLETYMTGLFVSNSHSSSLNSLKNKLEEQEALLPLLSTDDSFDQFVDCDMDFHLIIANGSGNTYLAKLFSSVLQNIREYAVTTFRTRTESPEAAVEMHRKIFNAMRDQDKDAAVELMKQHIMSTAS